MTISRINVDIDVDFDDLDENEMAEYLEVKGWKIFDVNDSEYSIDDLDVFNKIYNLIILKNKDQAIEEMHKFLSEKLGRAL